MSRIRLQGKSHLQAVSHDAGSFNSHRIVPRVQEVLGRSSVLANRIEPSLLVLRCVVHSATAATNYQQPPSSSLPTNNAIQIPARAHKPVSRLRMPTRPRYGIIDALGRHNTPQNLPRQPVFHVETSPQSTLQLYLTVTPTSTPF